MGAETVTVIGGAGFLGRELVNQLLSRGFKVAVADIHPSLKSNRLPSSLTHHAEAFASRQLNLAYVDVTKAGDIC